MKQLLSILFILLIQAFSVSAQPVQQHEVNWKSINTSMHQYLKYPSSKNARHITSVLPDSPISQTNKSTIATKTTAYVYHILNMVGRQVISGDSAAVHLAFKLRNISDGAFTESLDIMLGKLIRIHPHLFLKQLQKNKTKDMYLRALVGNLGSVYVDRYRAQLWEIKRRIKALQSVNDLNLAALKVRFIKKLKANQATVKKAVRNTKQQ